MLPADYHTHSHFCDGKGRLEEYAPAARRAGLRALGFSGHAPLPFRTGWTMPLERLPAYLAAARREQAAWRAAGGLAIRVGLEVDILPGLEAFYRRHVLPHGLDYVVASVHYVDSPEHPVDLRAEDFVRSVQTAFGGSVERYVRRYYELVAELARTVASWGLPALLGHLDKVKMWFRSASGPGPDATTGSSLPGGESIHQDFAPPCPYEDMPWYREAALAALRAVRETGLILEVNTAGWRRAFVDAPYPSGWLLREACALGLPVAVCSDAHTPQEVAAGFGRAAGLLAKAGYQTVSVLAPGGGWQQVPVGLPLVDGAPRGRT